jgi:hypothetical protein
LTQLLQYLTDQKIPEVARIEEFIPIIEKRAKIGFWGKKINVYDYLGKHQLKPLQTKTDLRYKYYGELDARGEVHGRGICIDNNCIIIGYWENDYWRTGNFIHIYSDGRFKVEEIYMKKNKRLRRGTCYHKNGKEEKYDEEC